MNTITGAVLVPAIRRSSVAIWGPIDITGPAQYTAHSCVCAAARATSRSVGARVSDVREK